MNDRTFGAALDAHFARRFDRAYPRDDHEDLDSWYTVPGLGHTYEVHPPARGGSRVMYTRFSQASAEALVEYLNEHHPEHSAGDPEPDLDDV